MMAGPLVSSPLGNRRLHANMAAQAGTSGTVCSRNARVNLFDQPSSPRLEQQDDLPAEFGDQSFGSSMSLGSSFEIGRRAAAASAASQASPSQLQDLARVSSNAQTDVTASPQRSSPSSANPFLSASKKLDRRSPPRNQDSLGASMGTELNSKSPGLAAKMSSPQPMDISPAPLHLNKPGPLATTPSKFLQRSRLGTTQGIDESSSNETLPPGSAMKEDTPEQAFRAFNVARHFSSLDDDRASLHGQGGSLGRLFGTELSLNQKAKTERKTSVDCVFGIPNQSKAGLDDNSTSSLDSPDKEPPAKRRPSSLPQSHNLFGPRSHNRLSGSNPSTSSSNSFAHLCRPSLLKAMTDGTALEESARERKDVLNAARQLHRSSDSALSNASSLTFGRPNRSRAGSVECGTEPARDRLSKGSLPPPSHPTIVESPSPSKLPDSQFAEYFLDPQSPEALQAKKNQRPQTSSSLSQQSLTGAAMASTRATTSQRPRFLEKAASSAVLPTMLGSSLGKRSNPYAKRPPLSQQNSGVSVKSALAAPGISSRLRPSAPRRCHSALDNSAAFAVGEDLSMGSADGSSNSIEESPCAKERVRLQRPSLHLPPGFEANGSPSASEARARPTRPNFIRRTSKDDSSPLGYGKRFTDAEAANSAEMDSSHGPRRPSIDNNLPGFGASEREGKVLPCFSVKNDGLMRITPETMRDVLDGQFDSQIDSFVVVDCRFGYEYDGGHIRGAVNLSTLDKVKRHFLEPSNSSALPLRSQSGKADSMGKREKKVVIFHCEFSQKRGPSSALALRQADRSLAADYPNCHYPELYVLDGGYAGFYKENASVCDPPCYVQMDDPNYQESRSRELNGFRKQFSRHRSFTYGDAFSSMNRPSFSDGVMGAPKQASGAAVGRGVGRPAIQEEDSSFDDSGSPSAAQSNFNPNRPRALQRHATAGLLQFPSSNTSAASNQFLSERWTASTRTQGAMPLLQQSARLPPSKLGNAMTLSPPSPAESLGHRPILGSNGDLAADLSFGSSIGATAEGGNMGDDSTSSFDVSGLCESPCAAAQNRGGNPLRLPARR